MRAGSRLDFSLFTYSFPCFLHPVLSLSLSEAPSFPPPPTPPLPPMLSPSPLKGTLLGPTVCVTSWAGPSQWGMQRCVSVFTLVYMSLQWTLCGWVCGLGGGLGVSPCNYILEAVFAVTTYTRMHVLSLTHTHWQTHTHMFTPLSDPPVLVHSREQREEVEQEANGYVCLPICPWHDQLISRLIHCHMGSLHFHLNCKWISASFRLPFPVPVCAMDVQ